MIFGITDEGVPTSKKEEYLIAIVALNNARTFIDDARDALLGNDYELRDQLWQMRKELQKVVKDLEHDYKKIKAKK